MGRTSCFVGVMFGLLQNCSRVTERSASMRMTAREEHPNRNVLPKWPKQPAETALILMKVSQSGANGYKLTSAGFTLFEDMRSLQQNVSSPRHATCFVPTSITRPPWWCRGGLGAFPGPGVEAALRYFRRPAVGKRYQRVCRDPYRCGHVRPYFRARLVIMLYEPEIRRMAGSTLPRAGTVRAARACRPLRSLGRGPLRAMDSIVESESSSRGIPSEE